MGALRPRGEAGIAMADVMIGMLLLSLVTLWGMDMFAAGIAQTRSSGVQAEAAVWAQAEFDYMRGLGYEHPCMAAATRTITTVSPPCTALEPPLPTAFAQATMQIEDNVLAQPGLKRVTLELFRPAGTVLYRVVTYASDFD